MIIYIIIGVVYYAISLFNVMFASDPIFSGLRESLGGVWWKWMLLVLYITVMYMIWPVWMVADIINAIRELKEKGLA